MTFPYPPRLIHTAFEHSAALLCFQVFSLLVLLRLPNGRRV